MRRRFRNALTLVLVGTVLLSACARDGEPANSGMSSPPEETPRPTLPSPLPGRTVAADGQLASPYPLLPLGFGGSVSGQVLSILVQAGDVVSEGNPLALLDDTELQRSVDDAQVALERTQADLERAQLQWERDLADAEQNLATAERNLTTAQLQYSQTSVEEAQTALDRAIRAEEDAEDEYNRTFDRQWEPFLDVDAYYDAWQRAIRDRELAELRLADAEDSLGASSLELEARREEVARAERALAALQAGVAPSYERAVQDAARQLTQAEEALARARLVAPWDGIVYSVDVAPAASVSAATPVVTLINTQDGLRFVTQNLSEQHIINVRPGQAAVVTLRSFGETPLEGEVAAVVPQTGAGGATEARFAVHVMLAPTDLSLLPGLTGRVEIVTGE